MRAAPTDAEAVLWRALRGRQLGWKFRRQALMLGYIVDFYCAVAKLAVEADGAVHDPAADAIRDAALARVGIRTMRFQNGRILEDLAAVLEEIRAACASGPIACGRCAYRTWTWANLSGHAMTRHPQRRRQCGLSRSAGW